MSATILTLLFPFCCLETIICYILTLSLPKVSPQKKTVHTLLCNVKYIEVDDPAQATGPINPS